MQKNEIKEKVIWPDGIIFSTVEKKEFWTFVEPHLEKVFVENELILRPLEICQDKSIEKIKRIRRQFKTVHEKYFLLRDDKNNLIGWSWGHQANHDSFYMVNSAILEKHRRKGYYTKILKQVIQNVINDGFDKIYSRHNIDNNSVIIPKLKCGFKISSLELSEYFGTLVHLTYFNTEVQNKVYSFRAGSLRPDEELKKLFKI